MGFDVYGLKPETDVIPDQPNWSQKYNEEEAKAYFAWQSNTPGAYFRNNVWWWRPLWDFVCETCNDILSEDDIKTGAYNDGHKIGKTKSKKIASRLRKVLRNGECESYKIQYDFNNVAAEDVECDLCNGTGKREDMKVPNGCNGCSGKGFKRPFQTNYPFSVANVKEFERFCEESGGFEIW